MIDILRIRLNQVVEEVRVGGLAALSNKMIKFNRVIVPVYKDLTALKEVARSKIEQDALFVKVTNGNLADLAPLYTVKSRRLKAFRNVSLGYVAYAVIINNRIVGDIWCAEGGSPAMHLSHPDLVWLGIAATESDAYMFDMYLHVDQRGNAITNFLLGRALEYLKNSGFLRVYGYYERENLPALWVHRLFGYRELKKITINQVLFFRKVINRDREGITQ